MEENMVFYNKTQPDLDIREKIQALSLAKDCYTTKLELLTNATVVDDAIRFVAGHQQNHNEKPDKRLDRKQGETVETAPNIATTMNQVF